MIYKVKATYKVINVGLVPGSFITNEELKKKLV